jgi:hypothetical protein
MLIRRKPIFEEECRRWLQARRYFTADYGCPLCVGRELIEVKISRVSFSFIKNSECYL